MAFAIALATLSASADPASQARLLSTARATLASEIEAGLPEVALGSWLSALVGPGVPLEWALDDCGEQSGDPERDGERELPVCAGLRAPLPDGRSVYLNFFAEPNPPGIEDARLVFAGILAEGRALPFASLGALAAHLETAREAPDSADPAKSER